ncbi:MAG: PAS domain-containing protein [Pseudomonadota bacterium]
MNSADLTIMNAMPFLFWAKGVDGTYLWGNKTINTFGGGSVVGKSDYELPWADTADALVAHDNLVLEKGEADFMHEVVHQSSQGEATLNVCKFPGELDGIPCTFGVSFVIRD